jgi:hypothetical protein
MFAGKITAAEISRYTDLFVKACPDKEAAKRREIF